MRKSHAFFAAAVLSLTLAEPEQANACGGTFCDSGPQAMPVDQSGENVLFVMDGKYVEAHVQIQYQGAAERFAWIVPMPKVPEVQVGSALLFNALLQGTVPQYGFTQQNDVCEDRSPSDSFAGAGGAMNSGSGGAAGAAGSGPQVVYEKTVGAFEVVVLQGGTAEEVSKWLGDNSYQNIPSAPEILKDYVNQNYVFVAIKLTAGSSSNEIHPLVFKYEGDEPCVPLKLTRVAATEDMGVRTFFLGDDRVVPTNFKHVTLNPARIDWSSMGQNYMQAVSRAVDSPVANGKAFVTEYAGQSSVVQTFSFYNPGWNSQLFEGAAATEIPEMLSKLDLLYCYGYQYGECEYRHPLLEPLLDEYLPVPSGLTPSEFYGSIQLYSDQIDQTKWNAVEFAADFKLRIQDPAKHAADIVQKWPYLTRLFTTISPSEMTEDPMFHARPGLDPVQPQSIAVRHTNCCGATTMELADGRDVAFDKSTGSWPVWDSGMPWADQIEEFPLNGEKITLVDNTEKIAEQLSSWNAKNDLTCETPATKGGISDTDDVFDQTGAPSCAASGRSPFSSAALLLAAVGLGLARRRRRH
jgi:MYXO-CTERM domain-containing protein